MSDALAAIAEHARQSRSDAVLVMQGGNVLYERYSGVPDKPFELMSVTKSVVALAVGAALADGLLPSLDTPVHAIYPEWRQGRKQSITVRMLMDHTSGLQNQLSAYDEIYPAPDFVQLALAAELTHDPGQNMAYNNKATNLLSGIVAKLAGKPMDRYVQERLFDPLGIRPGGWSKDAAGNAHAMAGLQLTARDTAKLGQLLLSSGTLEGRSLLPASYIEEMWAPSRRSSELGLLWWRRTAWTRFRADEESLELLNSLPAPPDWVAKLNPLLGRTFDSPESLYAGLAECLGDDWGERWARELSQPHGIGPWRPFHPEKGPVERFEGNGDLGQYLVVVPKASIVAVRQFEDRPDRTAGDRYPEFGADIQRLADAWVERHRDR